MDPVESRIEWCEEATERGNICTHIRHTSKASRRNRRFDCPACRNKRLSGGGREEEGSGGGSMGSTTAIGGATTKVGA